MADADFNYSSGRIPADLVPRLDIANITGRSIEDTVDLLCYRQMHSPILTLAPYERSSPSLAELGSLSVASCLEVCPVKEDGGNAVFKHPSGYEVEAKQEFIRSALTRLQPLWPLGLGVAELFADVKLVSEDLRLLHRHGLIELRYPRYPEATNLEISAEFLNQQERDWGSSVTTPYHQTYRVARDRLTE